LLYSFCFFIDFGFELTANGLQLAADREFYLQVFCEELLFKYTQNFISCTLPCLRLGAVSYRPFSFSERKMFDFPQTFEKLNYHLSATCLEAIQGCAFFRNRSVRELNWTVKFLAANCPVETTIIWKRVFSTSQSANYLNFAQKKHLNEFLRTEIYWFRYVC
jgi:hypothetical protein